MQQLDLQTATRRRSHLADPGTQELPYEKGTFHGYGIQDFFRAEPRFA